jgi:CRISPR-associated protein Cas2
VNRSSKFIVVYDVADDKERKRLSKILEGYGFRVQKSAFECVLNRYSKSRLIEQIKKLELQTGFVNIYGVRERGSAISIGATPGPSMDDGCAFIV